MACTSGSKSYLILTLLHQSYKIFFKNFSVGEGIPGQGTEGHLVRDFKTEVGPPVQIQKNHGNFFHLVIREYYIFGLKPVILVFHIIYWRARSVTSKEHWCEIVEPI